MKKCLGCDTIKPLSEFSARINTKVGVQSKCKTCNKQYRTKHQEHINANQKAYYQDNRQEMIADQKRRDALRVEEISINKKAHYQANKSLLAQYKKEYREANPGKINAWVAKRAAAKLQRTPKWLSVEQLSEIEEFYTIAKEIQWLSSEKLHVDHIVPLQGKNVSGLHVPWNLQILPASINISKSNKCA